MRKQLLTVLFFFISVLSYADNQYDMIFTVDREQIQCNVKEISDSTVFFMRAGKPATVTYSMSKNRIVLIQYADGTTETFSTTQQKNQSRQNQDEQYSNQSVLVQPSLETFPKDYAIVNIYGGVYVFNDCTPVDKYEVLGDVVFGGSNGGGSFMSMPNGLGGTTMIISDGETPQYTSIRNGLVANALMANRMVDGIIINITNEGEGRATMIKFREKSENNKLAKVNNHKGLYVFSDCKPYNQYVSVEKIKGKLMSVSSRYDYLRDKLVDKALKKKNCNAVIVNLVEGGRDYIETINL